MSILKRAIPLLLCVVMLAFVFVACDTDSPEETSSGTTSHTHTPAAAVQENYVDSTCTQTGSYDEVVYCSACHEEISRTQKTVDKKSHDFNQKAIASTYLKDAATCTESAVYFYSCACGEKGTTTFTAGEPNGHTYGTWIEEVPATCEGTGTLGHYHCDACGKDFDANKAVLSSLVISANGHNYGTWINEIPATCEGEGTLGHYHCDACDKDFDANKAMLSSLVISSNGHTYGTWINEILATCEGEGTLGHYHCDACGKDFDTDKNVLTSLAISAKGHTYGTWITEVPATCEGEGTLGHYHCDACGKDFDTDKNVLTSLAISAKGHTYGTWITEVPATCEGEGTLGHYHCDKCNKNFDADKNVLTSLVIPANGHNYGTWINEIPATCEGEGTLDHYHCDACGKNFDTDKNILTSLVIPANGHTYGTWINEIPATCEGEGTLGHYHCDACGKDFDTDKNVLASLAISANGHTYGTWITEVPATCEGEGTLGHYHCDACGKDFDTNKNVLTSLVIPANGHNYGTWINEIPATCEGEGTLGHYHCDACGKDFDADKSILNSLVISANGHEHEPAITAPTCTAKGYTTYTCHCGDTYTDDEIAANGHSYDEWIVTKDPTETAKGEKRRDCKNCEHFETDVVAELAHDHSRHGVTVLDAVAPTCTATGLTEGKKCSGCGEVLVAQQTVPANGHTWGAWAETKAPTCTEKGTERRDCEHCDHYETNEIKANGHTNKEAIVENKVEATCTADGSYDSVIYCSVCNGEVSREAKTIGKLGHNYSTEWTVDLEPTCTEKGSKSHHCSRCSDQADVTEIAANGHDHESVVTLPTCTTKGYTTYTCHCGDTYIANEVAANGHSYDEWIVTKDPTETAKGEKRRDCKNCDYYETEVIAELEHDHSRHGITILEAVAPTCTTTGLTEGKKCSGCGEVLVAQQTVPANGHTWGAWAETKAPTCTEKGTERRDCEHCDHYETNEIKANGHTNEEAIVENKVEATCTADGSYDSVIYCSVCNAEVSREAKTIGMLGHNYSTEWTVDLEPTCTEKGSKSHHCSRCSDKADVTEIAANGHDHESVVIAPTCTEKGYTTYTCHCGDTYTADEKAALGHTEVTDAAVAATCTTSGKTEGKHCSVCSTILVAQTVVPATGHSYSTAWEQNDTHHWHKSTCGHTSEVSNRAEHNFGDDLICDTCLFEKEEDKISFKTLQANGTNVYGKVSNTTTTFSFLTEITKSGKATFEVFRDLECSDIIRSKTASLVVGDNTFYILEYVDGEVNALYTVTVRRKPMYTVTFDTKGGTSVKSQTVEEDALAMVFETTKTGYTFAGWNYDFSTPVTQDTVITASWTANTYTITYDVNGGDALESHTQTVTYDEAYTLAVPTRTGYTFVGWYNGETPFADGAWNLTDGITLTAKWEIITYNISYNLEGGAAENEATYTVEDEITLTAPTRTGYTFVGWTYEGQDEPILSVTIAKGTIGNLSYTANWTVNTYTITYDVNGGDALENHTQTVTYDSDYTLAVPTRIGYTFEGWFIGEDPFENGTWNLTESIELTAKWKINQYQITTDKNINNGTVTGAGSYDYNTTATLTATPNLGYFFDGWYCGEELISVEQVYTFTVTESFTLTANFRFDERLNDFYFSSTQTTCVISGVKDKTKTSYEIPEYVTSIGYDAFSGCSSLTSITIPDSVTSIVSYAFYNCSSLTSITIPNSVTSIGYGAFEDCDNLTSITLPFVGAKKDSTSNTHFGYIFGASSYSDNDDYVPNSLKTVVITGGTSIGNYAFYDCDSLTSITIPDSVTSIGDYAFFGCSSLTSITIPDSVTSIGNKMFLNCSSLTSITVDNGNNTYHSAGNCLIETASKTLILGCKKSVIPTDGSVTSIGSYAFRGCSSLTSITIPDSVTSIGECAFCDCSRLTSVTIGNGVTSIGSYAFRDCGSLTSITIPNSVTSIGDYAFYNCSSLTSVYYAGTADDWSKIGIGSYNEKLTSVLRYYYSETHPTDATNKYWHYVNGTITVWNVIVYIPNGDGTCYIDDAYVWGDITIPTTSLAGDLVTSIGSSAFYGCSKLTSITIPNSVTSIGFSAFYGCSNLTSITISDSVTSIGNSAFYECKSLTRITIPDSVTSIGYEAFEGCSRLTSITLPFVGASKNSASNTHFAYIFGASSPSYNNDHVPTTLKTVVITGGTSIGSNAFYKCSSLTSIMIPDSVTSIGEGAFSGCSSLTRVHITDLAAWCNIDFYGSSSNPLCYAHNLYLNGTLIEKLVIPDSVTSIDDSAFYGCSSLTGITIPDSVTSIGMEAFRDCSRLTSITLPFVGATKNGTSNTHFGYIFGASSYSYNSDYVPKILKTVVITGGTSIGSSAFQNCTGLTSINIPDSVTSIGNYAFDYCSSLTSINIPDSITSIGERAFGYCESLTSITIPDSVTSIGSSAFFGCSSLTGITIPDSVTSIGERAFGYCESLTSITIPDSVTSIGSSAFFGCSSLRSITLPFVGASKNGTSNTHFGYIFGASSYLYNSDYVPKILKTVVITGGTSIGSSVFFGCSRLTRITIPDSVTSIGSSAFQNCTGLTSITIPDSVKSVGNRAFDYCTGIRSVKIGTGVKSIDAWAFAGCRSLTSITIPDNVTSIGLGALSGCSGLTRITIPFTGASRDETENTNFGYIFATSAAIHTNNCPPSALKIVEITGCTTVKASAFYGCQYITTVIFGDSVTSIGNRAFYDCKSLTDIVLSKSVTSIGSYAFGNETNLATLYYSGSAVDLINISLGELAGLPNYTDRYYYSETQPTTTGNYWHYVDGVPTKW